MYRDNWSVIQSATIPEIKKKHIVIFYHYVRENITARIINPIWIRSDENFSDICTKAVGGNCFDNHVHKLMA